MVEFHPFAMVFDPQWTPRHDYFAEGLRLPTLDRILAVFGITIYETPLNVMLIATECSDGMSDRVYPLTARVEIGDDTLTGCAASKSAIMVQPAP